MAIVRFEFERLQAAAGVRRRPQVYTPGNSATAAKGFAYHCKGPQA